MHYKGFRWVVVTSQHYISSVRVIALLTSWLFESGVFNNGDTRCAVFQTFRDSIITSFCLWSGPGRVFHCKKQHLKKQQQPKKEEKDCFNTHWIIVLFQFKFKFILGIKLLLNSQSGTQPRMSRRNPTWPFHSSGRTRTYCAEIGVPNKRVSGVVLSTEPGYSCDRITISIAWNQHLWSFHR